MCSTQHAVVLYLHEEHEGSWHKHDGSTEHVEEGDGDEGLVRGQHVVGRQQGVGDETQQCHLARGYVTHSQGEFRISTINIKELEEFQGGPL